MTKKKKKVNMSPYLLVAPACIVILCVVFIPVIQAIAMSFQSYDLRRPNDIEFIGLQNYIEVFQDELFWKALVKTILWVVFGVGFQFIFGFILALLLNRDFKGRGVIRALSMIPWVTPGVLIGLMWRWMYDGNYGVINAILQFFHITKSNISFLSDPDTAFAAVIVTIVWQGIPFFALMLLAGLQNIPHDLYEAAAIDGANSVQRFFRITIPSMKNTIFVTVLLRVIWVANSVDVIFNMTEGGPAYSTQTLSVYIFNKANALDMGYSSAMAILLTILLCIVAIPYLRYNFKSEAEG
ncbi:MAG: sugar ABC transporter permease [Eubacteriales bacterium]|jgi:multiple sugar transport system permease protein